MYPKSFDELKEAMKAGSQSSGVSFWRHGELVMERFEDLMYAPQSAEWRIPKWFSENQKFIFDRLNPDMYAYYEYQLWHDCGKPYCRTVDENGKVHYPNHAQVSSDILRSLGCAKRIWELVRDDMLCHTLKPAQALEFAKNPNALVLLVTALCELHANASMFGGLDSESFKIKYKRLDRCGSIILSYLKESS